MTPRAHVVAVVVVVGAAPGAASCIDGEVAIGADHPDKVALDAATAACDAHCENRRSAECVDAEDCEAACEAQFERASPCGVELAALVGCASLPAASGDARSACAVRVAADEACFGADGALASCIETSVATPDDPRVGVECDVDARCTCFRDGEPVGRCDMLVDTRALASPQVGCCAPVLRDE